MLTKNRKKLIKSLHQKKYRDAHGLFLVEGEKIGNELLTTDLSELGFEVDGIYALQRLEEHYPNATIISENDMQSVTALKNNSGVLAVVKQSNQSFDFWENLNDEVIILDDIKDPGNLGTIIRSAEWFGIKEIIVSPQTVEWYNPKTVQSTMGSMFRVNIWKEDLSTAISKLSARGYVTYAADMGGKPIKDINWSPKKALIIGSEAHGLSEDVRALCQNIVSIPGKGKAESLNAGIAASVIISHWNY